MENRHKKTAYRAQKEWAKRNDFVTLSFRTYGHVKREIQALAKSQGMSVSQLIIGAIERQYGIDLMRPSGDSE